MSGYFIDLHTHSDVSDGTDSPAELVRKAARNDLAALALTDHDATEGLAEAERLALKLGIRFIRGCEIAAWDERAGEIHLLGLWLPTESGELEDTLGNFRQARAARNGCILDRLSGLGMPLQMGDVLSFALGVSPGRPHIARAMVAKGYVSSVREAFELHIGEQGKAFVPRILPGPEQAISLLSRLGATVSFAHPFLRSSMTSELIAALIPDFKDAGLTALEVYHSAHNSIQVRQGLELCDRFGLLPTGGSDYHGSSKPDVRLGTCGAGGRVPISILEKLEKDRLCRGLWI